MDVATILKVKGRGVATARPDATLQEIAEKLAAKRIGTIVIVGQNGEVSGIISERDIVRAIGQHGADCLSNPVSQIMTRTVISCSESDTLDQLMSAMTTGRFRHMPVVRDGALVGIVSIGDVVKHHVAEVEMEASALRTYIVAG